MATGEHSEPMTPDLKPGDLCHHGANALPLYRVVAVDGDKVWLRDVNTSADAVVDLVRCRLCGAEDAFVEQQAVGPTTLEWPDGTPRP